MKCIPMICKSCLLAAVHVSPDCELPDKPLQYLARALQHTSLTCPDARTVERDEVIGSVQSLQKRRLEHGNLVRAAVMRLASATKEREKAVGLHESDGVSELEGLLVAEGLPQREGGQDASLLSIAASYNSVEAVSLLYSFGANVNDAQDNGDQQTQTALERSAFLGHTDVASFLVANGGTHCSLSGAFSYTCLPSALSILLRFTLVMILARVGSFFRQGHAPGG